MLTKISVVDSLLLFGILTYSIVLVMLFYTLRPLLSENIALCSVVGTLAIPVYSFYSTYFFPESLAIGIFFYILYFVYRDMAWSRVLLVVFSSVFILTHHFSIILLSPVFAFYTLRGVSLRALRRDNLKPIRLSKSLFFLIIPLGAVSYWSFFSEDWYLGFYWVIQELIKFDLIERSSGGGGLYTYGLTISESPIVESFRTLISLHGMFYTLLLTVLFVSFALYLNRRDVFGMYVEFPMFAAVGALFVVKTPFSFVSTGRMALGYTLFLGVLLGVGIKRFVNRNSLQLSRNSTPIVVLVLLLASAPIVGSSFYDNQLPNAETPTQHALSEGEYAQISVTATFLKTHDAQVSTFWVSRMALNTEGIDRTTQARATPTGIKFEDGLFYYREAWTNYRVAEPVPGRLIVFRLTRAWLNSFEARHNKVYTTGETGQLWSGSRI